MYRLTNTQKKVFVIIEQLEEILNVDLVDSAYGNCDIDIVSIAEVGNSFVIKLSFRGLKESTIVQTLRSACETLRANKNKTYFEQVLVFQPLLLDHNVQTLTAIISY